MSTATIAKDTRFQWQLLKNSPAASSRTDDIWFFDELTGWLVNSSGYVCKTEDGGNYWTPKFFLYPNLPSKPYLRSMSWANRQIGWFGAVTNIGNASLSNLKYPSQYINTLLHHTTDGGETWNAVQNLPEDVPPGICGFHAVNEEVAYGSGTNDPGMKPVAVIKTRNNGASWEVIPMKEYCDNLIDVYFFDEDNGFVVGGKNDKTCKGGQRGYEGQRFGRYAKLKPVVLRTCDGGKTWKDTAVGTDFPVCGEWGWKIQFINDQIGFVALENFVDAAILTTTNGGESWTRKHVAPDQAPGTKAINEDIEGIGFIDEKRGWVGGWGTSLGGPTSGVLNSYTEDGGETWVPQNHVVGDPNSDPRIRINRYRFLRDDENHVTGGYCSGLQVYKIGAGGKKEAFGRKSTFGKKSAFAEGVALREPAHRGDVGKANDMPIRTDASGGPDHGFNLQHTPTADGKVEISYTLPEDSENVFVGLWNKFAFHIRTLVSEKTQTKGIRTVVWDGTDDQGDAAGKGMFICRMSTAGEKGASQMLALESGL